MAQKKKKKKSVKKDPFAGLTRQERMQKALEMARERYEAKRDERTIEELIGPAVEPPKKKKKKKKKKGVGGKGLMPGYFK